MAIQDGLIKLTGRLGNLSFYKMAGKYYVRRKTAHSSWRIQNDPAFANTYKAGLDFGEASRMSKRFRTLCGDVVDAVGDRRVAGRLTGRLVKVVQGDGDHDAGARRVGSGALSLLKGFEFNKHKDFSSYVDGCVGVVVDGVSSTVSVCVPGWSSAAGFGDCGGGTHGRLIVVVTCIDGASGDCDSFVSRSGYFDLSAGGYAPVTFVQGISGRYVDGLMVSVGIEFCRRIEGCLKPIRHVGAMVVVEACSVRRLVSSSCPAQAVVATAEAVRCAGVVNDRLDWVAPGFYGYRLFKDRSAVRRSLRGGGVKRRRGFPRKVCSADDDPAADGKLCSPWNV